MIGKDQVDRLQGATVVDSQGDKIGSVGTVYFDDNSGEPEWVTVSTGFFGTSETFVPLSQADMEGDGVRVPFTKDKVKDAPRVDADHHLDEDQERELYRYYGLDYEGGGEVAASGYQGDRGGDLDTERRDVSGRDTADAMTVSEERLKVGTEQREAGRARLRKHVVTEQQTVTVPVQREEVRIEREPITEANRGDATSGPSFTEAEHEVVLHEEQPVVSKEEVPVERVRLAKDTVTGEEQVSEEVRKERVVTEGDLDETELRDRGERDVADDRRGNRAT